MPLIPTRWRRYLDRRIDAYKIDDRIKRFIASNRKRWSDDYKKDSSSVVLLNIFEVNTSIYCDGVVANYLARRTGSVIEAYRFKPHLPRSLRKLHESFGAPIRLHRLTIWWRLPFIWMEANRIFQGLKSKWDVLEITVEGLRLGGVIYDTYLRYLEEPTIKLKDPRLRKVIFECLVIYHATNSYMHRKKVVAFLADDFSYSEWGIPLRVALRHKIPVFWVLWGADFYIQSLLSGDGSDHFIHPHRHPYHNFRKVFGELPPAVQEEGRKKGREFLERRLSGRRDQTSPEISAFGEVGAKAFSETGKPRMLVLLHDFIDAPHGFYRWMLFPDFYEWIHFLMEEAAKTPFDWYLKPHPTELVPGRRAVKRSNDAMVAQLKAMYPRVRVLDPGTSNRQLIAEGITAVFTVHGTAGHEFAKCGVTVVNGGDNPHVAYPFNFHPRTVEEFAEYIRQADRLKPQIDEDDIDEFVYMNYFHFGGHRKTTANPLDPALFADPAAEMQLAGSDAWERFEGSCSTDRDAKLKEYFDEYFRDLPRGDMQPGKA